MARIIELIPGKDGVVRTARVKTQHGILLRPVQKLYPLELSAAKETDSVSNKLQEILAVPPDIDNTESESGGGSMNEHTDVITRSGRKIVKPKRLED